MATNGATGDGSDPANTIKISVKFNGRSIPVNLSVESTVKDLKSALQPLTDVLPRGQKLIAKGNHPCLPNTHHLQHTKKKT